MNVRVIRRLGAVIVLAMSLIACGDSGDDGSSADPPTTAAPAPTTAAPDDGGTAACDKASVAAGIGDEVADIVDLECVDGWAAAVYTDNDGLSRPAILKSEGKLWVLQDWYAVCEGDPMVPGDIAVPESLRMYCPGG